MTTASHGFDWLLSDFAGVVPAGDRDPRPLPGKWQLVDYTTDAFDGRLILANPATNAPDVRVPLPVTGRHDIYLGLQKDLCDRVKIKLARDPVFSRLRHSVLPAGTHGAIEEVHWRRADIADGDELVIRQEPGYRMAVALVGMRSVADEPAAENEKRYVLHTTDDGYPGNWGIGDDGDDRTWNASAVARLGVDLLSYGTNLAGMANYPTVHPSLKPPLDEVAEETTAGPIYEAGVRNMIHERDNGINVARRYFEVAREQGLRTFAYARMGHTHCGPPYDVFRSTFFDAHPEFHCIDIDGVPVSRLSVAYPEVRQEFIKLFTECVEMGAEGINAVFVRGVPMVLYEEPVQAAFREQHGEDILALPENDPRAQQLRAEYVTTYMREQRAAVSAAAPARDVPVMAMVPATRKVCAFFGLDVVNWIKDGLVDILCPYRWGFDATDTPLEMDFFAEAVAGSDVKLLPFINTWRERTGLPLLEEALRLTAWPIDGLSIWDADSRAPDVHAAMRYLGSPDTIRAGIEALKTLPRFHTVRTINGFKNDKYHFGWIL